MSGSRNIVPRPIPKRDIINLVNEEIFHNIHSKNPLAMFAPQPVGISFEIQEDGEKIILLLRAHLITLIPPLILVIFLFVLPFVVVPFSGSIFTALALTVLPGQFLLIIVSWYLFVFGIAFFRFLLWYFNVYLLTNERIVDFDFKGLLFKSTSYAILRQIEDVDPKILGFFPTFFHYGDIIVQTASEIPEFVFEKVARPDDVSREILGQVRHEEGEAPGEIS